MTVTNNESQQISDSDIQNIALAVSLALEKEEAMKSKCLIEILGGFNVCLKRRDVVGLDIKIYDAWSFRVLFVVKSNIFIFNIDDILYSCDVKKEKFEVIRRGRIKPSS